jgi:hypothetical protein
MQESFPGGHMVVPVKAAEDIFKYGLLHEKRRLLEYPADTHSGDAVNPQTGNFSVLKEYLTFIGTVKPADNIEKCAFPGAVGPDQPEDFRAVYFKAHVAQGDKRTEYPGYVPNFQ